jgi:hypothetical protein
MFHQIWTDDPEYAFAGFLLLGHDSQAKIFLESQEHISALFVSRECRDLSRQLFL